MHFNINFDPSNLPTWILALLIMLVIAVELIRKPTAPTASETGLTAAECTTFCSGWPQSYTAYACTCFLPTGKE